MGISSLILLPLNVSHISGPGSPHAPVGGRLA
jgi:hypothetical protein